MRRAFLVILLIAGSLMLSGAAQANNQWNLHLNRLCRIQTAVAPVDCGGYTPAYGQISSITPDTTAFRSLMSEMGVIFAPNLLAPSDTQGYSGFNASVELGNTTVNTKNYARDPLIDGTNGPGHLYWRAAESVDASAFSQGNIDAQASRAQIEQQVPSELAQTITMMARKGFWFPLPSFEIGAGVRHLIGSTMWSPIVSTKLALHEGYHQFPLPSVAVRATGSRVMGATDFSLSLATLDFSLSKRLGLLGTWNITPYAGYQLLWIMADSDVLDATPGIDAVSETSKLASVNSNPLKMSQCRANDCNGFFAFANMSNITRHRVFFGLKGNFSYASLIAEYTYFASGGKSDQVFDQIANQSVPVADESAVQHTFNFAVAVDY